MAFPVGDVVRLLTKVMPVEERREGSSVLLMLPVMELRQGSEKRDKA